MRKGKLWLVVAALVAAASFSVSGASAKQHEEVTLNVLWVTTAQSAMELLSQNFTRVYPDIKLNVTYLPSGTLSQLLVTQLQGGSAPDVFWSTLGIGTNGVWRLAPGGYLMDLSKSPWVKRIYPPVRHYISYKNKVYAWPMVVTPHEPIANVDVINQLRLSPPKTFDQLLAQCKTIAAAGKTPFVQSMNTIAGGTIIGRQFYSSYVYNVDPNWDAKRYANKVTFASSPLWQTLLQRIKQMVDGGCFNQGAAGLSRNAQYASIASGEAAYSLLTSGEIANIQQINPKVNLKMYPLPAADPKNNSVQAYAGIDISGNAKTQHPNEVRTLINFLARAKQSTLFAKVAGGIAPYDAKIGVIAGPLEPLKTLMQTTGHADQTHEAAWPNPDVFTAFANGITGLFTGQSTVQSALEAMDKAWDQGKR